MQPVLSAQDLQASIQDLLPELREIRHDLHQHPELGFEEHRTQTKVREFLERHGYSCEPCAGTGLIADLRPGAGPSIGLRADLDALPIPEHTDLPYRSVHEGRAHKCGHDGHTTILLGTAALLARCRDRAPRNVRVLFQPAEEGVRGGGARVMVEEGALQGVEEVYGLHNWPAFPRGQLRVKAGPLMAQVHTLTIVLRGRGGHGSEPHRSRDPVLAACQLVNALQSVTSRGLSIHGGAVLSICSVRAGHTHNVIPGDAKLLGTVRTFDPQIGKQVIDQVQKIVRGCAESFAVEADLDIEVGFPVLVNSEECAAAVQRVGQQVFGEANVSAEGVPIAGGEDFAYLCAEVPGAYFFLGAGKPGEQTPGCHHPDFDFDDELLNPGMQMFVGLVQDAWQRELR